MKKKAVLVLVRALFRAAGTLAPEFAAKRAYAMFCKPFGTKPLNPVQEQTIRAASRHRVEVRGEQVAAYRWRGNGEAPRPLVLLTHGWGSRAGRLAVWIKPLLEAGFDVAALDAPAHGDSEGESTTLPKYVAAIKAVDELFGPAQAVIGHSFGGLCGAMATAGSKVVRTPDIHATHLVMIASPNSTPEVIARFGRFMGMNQRVISGIYRHIEGLENQPVEAYSASRVLAESSTKVLVVHDEADANVPFADGEAVAKSNPAIAFKKTRGLGHNRVARDPEVISAVIDFLKSDTGGSSLLQT